MDYLNPKSCKRLTGYTFIQLLSLSGIYGIHKPSELELKRPKYLQVDFDEKIVNIEIETDLVKEFRVRLDLSAKIIKNELFISSKLKDGLSFPRLVAQVDAAVSMKFNKITLHAWGDHSTKESFIGFIIWGRYGFQMASAKNRREFRNLMRQNGRNCKTLYDLLSTVQGVELWESIGTDWLGELKLSPKSMGMKIFTKVRNQKGL